MIRIARTARALALASLVALIATALAQGMNHGQMRGGAAQPGAAVSPMGMAMGMMATQTVDEASFLVHMIPHHQEAVASARALAAVTERPELLELLEGIVTSQTAEIEAMEGWLDVWHPDVDRAVAYVPMMRDLGPDAAVADVERAFLEDMIGHHMMAVHEAQTLLANGLAEHDEVAALARSIVTTQMGEMHQMATWLGAWFGADGATAFGPGAMGFGAMGPGAMGPGAMGMPGMGMPGMGMGGHGGAGFMGDHGIGGHGMDGHGVGVGGMHPHGGPAGSMAGFHQAMHGHETGATIGAADAERLALAFVAGRGDASAEVTGTSLVYEVVVRSGGTDQVLRVDARTGQVTVASER
jgi:uncharacterized protein (DUF305 family)